MSKVIAVDANSITFDTGHKLYSDHDQDCWESHYLSMANLDLSDFAGLEFNLDMEGSFFERVEDYGIRLLPINGHPVPIPGYGSNNGYYSSNLTLVVDLNGVSFEHDISECQEIEG